MRHHRLVAALALAAASVVPLTLAGTAGAAPGDTPVRAVNAYTYGAGNPFQKTICLDGVLLGDLATTEAGDNVDFAPGEHTLTVPGNFGTSCVGEGAPQLSQTVTIPASVQVSIVIWWAPGTGMTATVFDDAPGCADAGMGRVIARNVTTNGSLGDFESPNAGSDPALSVVGVARGGEGSVDVAATAYADGQLTVNSGFSTEAAISAFTVADGTRNTIYGYGGDDGDIGTFLVQDKIDTCAVVTTTTTTVAPTTTLAPTTTVAASPATAVPATPTYTG